MYLANLIKNVLTHNRSYKFITNVLDPNTIKVTYNLSIPNWVNDKEVLTQDNMSILYSRYTPEVPDNNIYVSHYVNNKNVDDDYPLVGNKKWFRVSKTYLVTDLIDKELIYYFYKESEKALAEIKSYILLQKIGDLSAQWEAVNTGKHSVTRKFNYGVSKMSYSKAITSNIISSNPPLEQPIDFNINAI